MATSESKVMIETAVNELRELAAIFDSLSMKPDFSLTKRLWWGQTSKSLNKIAHETENQFRSPL